jgi:hypothetical protein
MAKLSHELIQTHFESWKKLNKSKHNFGYIMNELYNLNDKELSEEKDSNMAILILLKNHVYTKK